MTFPLRWAGFEGFSLSDDSFTLDSSPIQILTANNQRQVILLSNLGSEPIIVRPSGSIPANRGVLIPPNNTPVTFSVEIHGPILVRQWFARSTAVGSTLYVGSLNYTGS